MKQTERLFLRNEYFEGRDLSTGELVSELSVRLSADQIKDGLISHIGVRNFGVLLVIASHMNKHNLSFPSVELIAETTGLSKPTVVTAIKQLEKIEIGGSKIIQKKKIPSNTGHLKSVYYLIEDGNPFFEEDEEVKPATPADYIVTFSEAFERKYGRKYVPNYARDAKMVKDKLMTAFPEDDLKEIVQIAVMDYEEWSSNPKFPTPTIGALCTWLANKAADKLEEQKKQQSAMETRIASAVKAEALNPVEQLDLLGGL